MLTEIKNNKSLSFYQQTTFSSKRAISSFYSSGVVPVAVANTSMITGNITAGYNSQYTGFVNALNTERDRLAQKVADGLSTYPNYTGARGDGVSLAWDYEAADIEMGGNGSAKWNKVEREEILVNQSVKRAEGHHQKNVAAHPEHQANPDNIKFYKDRESHYKDGHGGKWDNETDASFIDKNKMLKKTNTKRVFKNELQGLGIAVAIGAGVGLTIGFVVTLAQSGVTPESLKLAFAEGAKGGGEAGLMSALGYGVARTIGQVVTKAVIGILDNLGITITDNISKMCSFGVVGTMTVLVFAAYQLIRLKLQGIGTRDALIQVGKQTLFSLSLLAVTIAAQGIWGGPAGIIVSVSIGIIIISYMLVKTVHQRQFAEKVRVYMIDKCRPVFVE